MKCNFSENSEIVNAPEVMVLLDLDGKKKKVQITDPKKLG